MQVALTRLTTEEKILKLSEIIEQGPSGVATLDGAGAIDYSNKRFHDITGYDVSDLIGKNADFLGKDLEDREMVDKINEVVISGQVWKGDLYNKRKDGSRFWERTSIFPVLDENPQRPARLQPLEVGRSGQGAGLDQGQLARGEGGVAILLLLHLQRRVEMKRHA